MVKFHIEKAEPPYKWVGVFESFGRETRIRFGAVNYEDYTQHKNPIRKTYYIARHRSREDWTKPMTAGALSRWILWETPSIEKNVKLFKERFNLE